MKMYFKQFQKNASHCFFGHLQLGEPTPHGFTRPLQAIILGTDGTRLHGFFKPNSFNGMLNHIEIGLKLYADILDVDLADVVQVFEDCDHTRLYGVVSVDVRQTPADKLLDFDSIKEAVYQPTVGLPPWALYWLSLRQGAARKNVVDLMAEGPYDLHCAIVYGEAVGKSYCNQQYYHTDFFLKQYIKMLLFDIIFGQKDRTPQNYMLLLPCDGDQAQVAPLFDNASLLRCSDDIVATPNVGEEWVVINRMCAGQRDWCRAVHHVYPQIAMEVAWELYQRAPLIQRELFQYHIPHEINELLYTRMTEGIEIIRQEFFAMKDL